MGKKLSERKSGATACLFSSVSILLFAALLCCSLFFFFFFLLFCKCLFPSCRHLCVMDVSFCILIVTRFSPLLLDPFFHSFPPFFLPSLFSFFFCVCSFASCASSRSLCFLIEIMFAPVFSCFVQILCSIFFLFIFLLFPLCSLFLYSQLCGVSIGLLALAFALLANGAVSNVQKKYTLTAENPQPAPGNARKEGKKKEAPM